MEKTYFITDKLYNKFPSSFVCSRNKRYIVVQDCRCKIGDKLYVDLELHASFVQRDAYCDHFVMFCNDAELAKYKKYEWVGSENWFEIWFTDMEGRKYICTKDMTEEEKKKYADDSKYVCVEDMVFKLQMMLVY